MRTIRDTSHISVAPAPSLRLHPAFPRIARIIAAGYPHHITQRGNNRATVFFDDEDRQAYLNLLLKYTRTYDVTIWAYCLMNNHVHLLAVPSWLAADERRGYAKFLTAGDEEMDADIRRATRTGRPVGSETFIDQMEFSLNQRLRPGSPGRPRKTGKCP